MQIFFENYSHFKFDFKKFLNNIVYENNSHFIKLTKIIMKELYKKLLEAHNKMLEIHIDTKTMEADFHNENEKFYEELFETAHLIWEKYVDLGWKIDNSSLEEKKSEAYKILKEAREEIENYAKNNEISLWTEDLLWSLANTLEWLEGTAKSFLK